MRGWEDEKMKKLRDEEMGGWELVGFTQVSTAKSLW
jgi:hypothetical protein